MDPPAPVEYVPNLKGLTLCESRDRTSHLHWDGCEVQREFYVTPYSEAPTVCAALLGFVVQVGQRFVRYLPAFDPYYNEILYCNEAKWDTIEKKAISNSPAVGAQSGNISTVEAYNYFKTQVNTKKETAEGGAFITASYRPMISAYHGDAYSSGAPGRIEPRDRQFDFMDPLIVPGERTIPWPTGVLYRTAPSEWLHTTY